MEIETLEKMVGLYCRGRHGGKELCASCAELLAYAAARLAKCPHHPKPACKDCRTHCYSPGMRARVKEVMRYSGPRMALRHPILTLKHRLSGIKRPSA